MTRYLIKGPCEVGGEFVFFGPAGDRSGVRRSDVEAIEDSVAVDLSGNSMHAIGLMIDKRNIRIKGLELEVAKLKIGGQPASMVRDLALTALKKLADNLKNRALESDVDASIKDVEKLIDALGGNIPGDVEYRAKAGEKVEGGGIKPYKSLDHGPKESVS